MDWLVEGHNFDLADAMSSIVVETDATAMGMRPYGAQGTDASSTQTRACAASADRVRGCRMHGIGTTPKPG